MHEDEKDELKSNQIKILREYFCARVYLLNNAIESAEA